MAQQVYVVAHSGQPPTEVLNVDVAARAREHVAVSLVSSGCIQDNRSVTASDPVKAATRL